VTSIRDLLGPFFVTKNSNFSCKTLDKNKEILYIVIVIGGTQNNKGET
jgi:hypothetical protein